ncbi:ribosomal RNA-processing protein 7-domain-containing protein [Podospora australis]|uniref:Ribosomal RNA-processing protein 7-domain-containing protein n=1 Tax=Podospora australis TaxID=1536484 RepID=A0AAN6WZC5_9PEZI|nr:ribosomal RNA-processing protein 7-domain-containing protein [Podospora australis]
MPSTQATIGDFSILPISIPPLPSFPKSNVVHYLYVRRNTPKIPTANDSRSLFLTNCPVDSTELHLRSLFSSLVGAGRFESCTFEDEREKKVHQSGSQSNTVSLALTTTANKKRKRGPHDEDDLISEEEEESARLPQTWSRTLHKSGGTAVVLLADEKSVEQVFKAIAKLSKSKKSSSYPQWPSTLSTPLGSVWLKSHNRSSYPDPAALQASIDAFSLVYARREKAAAKRAKRLRNEPDADGFVTVTRGGRNAPASKLEAEEAKRKMLERAAKKREETSTFYQFQLREKKKEEQDELVKRFEEDRKKLEQMRMKRGKFAPEA